jgi:hypothetical protein
MSNCQDTVSRRHGAGGWVLQFISRTAACIRTLDRQISRGRTSSRIWLRPMLLAAGLGHDGEGRGRGMEFPSTTARAVIDIHMVLAQRRRCFRVRNDSSSKCQMPLSRARARSVLPRLPDTWRHVLRRTPQPAFATMVRIGSAMEQATNQHNSNSPRCPAQRAGKPLPRVVPSGGLASIRLPNTYLVSRARLTRIALFDLTNSATLLQPLKQYRY